MEKLVTKRDGSVATFDKARIESAILKAMKHGTGTVKKDIAKEIAEKIEERFGTYTPTVKKIEEIVYEMLIECGEELTAKSYEGYRAIQSFKKKLNTTDDSIIGLVRGTNEEVIRENSNKNARTASTQRDLIAGEVSKDIARRKLIPAHIVQAHDDGILHWHDMDYSLQEIFNCCLVNLKDMLDNGTVINGKMISSPNSFKTACTIATQIMAQVASGQFGGQTSSLSHLAPYVRKSYEGYKKAVLDEGIQNGIDYTVEQIESIAWMRTKKEVADGVQTIQYQINTLATSNGQSPFVSLFLYIGEDSEYEKETALIVEEVLKQRLKGVQNEQGVWITPAFPKLLYVLDENNVYEKSKYEHITRLAVKCVAKRMMPDFISAKKMKEHYEGNVFPCIKTCALSK